MDEDQSMKDGTIFDRSQKSEQDDQNMDDSDAMYDEDLDMKSASAVAHNTRGRKLWNEHRKNGRT